jgi:hypothetical protein
MKRTLAILAMVAMAALAVPAQAGAVTHAWGLHIMTTDPSPSPSVYQMRETITPASNWQSDADGYVLATMLVSDGGSGANSNFMQIGITRDGANWPGTDDCGVAAVKKIFVEWISYPGQVYHCWLGQDVSQNEAHVYRLARCDTANSGGSWCAYVDGSLVVGPKTLGFSDGFHSGASPYTGLESGNSTVAQLTAGTTFGGDTTQAPQYPAWQVSDDLSNPYWNNVTESRTCRYNNEDHFRVNDVGDLGNLWENLFASASGPASTC